ncbi:hypothetical protein V6N13_084207 [Hibiscus sabdariffa]
MWKLQCLLSGSGAPPPSLFSFFGAFTPKMRPTPGRRQSPKRDVPETPALCKNRTNTLNRVIKRYRIPSLPKILNKRIKTLFVGIDEQHHTTAVLAHDRRT